MARRSAGACESTSCVRRRRRPALNLSGSGAWHATKSNAGTADAGRLPAWLAAWIARRAASGGREAADLRPQPLPRCGMWHARRSGCARRARRAAACAPLEGCAPPAPRCPACSRSPQRSPARARRAFRGRTFLPRDSRETTRAKTPCSSRTHAAQNKSEKSTAPRRFCSLRSPAGRSLSSPHFSRQMGKVWNSNDVSYVRSPGPTRAQAKEVATTIAQRLYHVVAPVVAPVRRSSGWRQSGCSVVGHVGPRVRWLRARRAAKGCGCRGDCARGCFARLAAAAGGRGRRVRDTERGVELLGSSAPWRC